MYALFCVSPGDRVTYMINPSSHANPNHLSYFKFVGRVIGKFSVKLSLSPPLALTLYLCLFRIDSQGRA